MTNSRELIIEEFHKRRARNPNFSMRAFAQWLGISPAQLSQMMTGKRTITLKTMQKITNRLGLSPIEKKRVVNSLLKDKKFIETSENKQTLHLEEDQFRMISDWYHFAILSLTKLKDAQADPRWVARRLGISVEEANQAMLRLERMGILQLKPIFKQIGEPIEVASKIPSEAIRKYHKQNLSLAIEKVDTVPLELRELQSISLTLNPQNVTDFKEHIDEFLAQSSELSEKINGTEVYHLNVQLIPMTVIKEN